MYKKKCKKVQKMAYGSGKKGVKKMRGGGIAAAGTSTGPATITAVNQPTTPIPPRAPNLGPRPKGGAGIDSPLGGRGVRRFKDGGMACGGRAARQARQRSV